MLHPVLGPTYFLPFFPWMFLGGGHGLRFVGKLSDGGQERASEDWRHRQFFRNQYNLEGQPNFRTDRSLPEMLRFMYPGPQRRQVIASRHRH